MKIVQFVVNLFLPSSPTTMDEPLSNSIVNLTGIQSGTLQDIAYKVVEDQINSNTVNTVHITQERTIFVLGSKGVVSQVKFNLSCVLFTFLIDVTVFRWSQGKTTIINNFLDRSDTTKPTLALEYSFGRRTGGPGQGIQKQVCNVWELGSLTNSSSLINVPMKSHGLKNFSAVIVLNLQYPDRLWGDLEAALKGLKQTIGVFVRTEYFADMEKMARKRIGSEHPDLSTLDPFPFPVCIIGGCYDKFQDFGE